MHRNRNGNRGAKQSQTRFLATLGMTWLRFECPHPASGHPLPVGEGRGEGALARNDKGYARKGRSD